MLLAVFSINLKNSTARGRFNWDQVFKNRSSKIF